MGDPKAEDDVNTDADNLSAKASKRLRLSVVDFNAGFSDNSGADVDSSLLDIFKTSRIDDYTLVNCIFFNGENANHDANPPAFARRGFGPRGHFDDATRLSYLGKLIAGLHSRGIQVIVGYTLDEGAPKVNPKDPDGPKIANITPDGTAFRSWLANATTAQVTAHGQQIADFFFKTNQLDIDGVDFDFEINGLGSNANHAANVKTLFTATATAMNAGRAGASVSYDNTTFLGSDGNSRIGHFKVQPYSIAAGTTNIIARPMHNLDASANKSTIQQTIALALQSGAGGGGLAPGNLQIMLDFAHTGASTVEDICRTVLLPNRVGLVLYNMGTRSFDATQLQTFATAAQKWDAALNPAAAAPGKKSMPVQAPLGADLP